METRAAAYLNQHVDDRIERRRLTGSRDRGDIAGIRCHGHRVVAEVKDYGGKIEAGKWLTEAETERINDGAEIAVVIAKRRGTSDPGAQFVLMTLADFAALLTDGLRP